MAEVGKDIDFLPTFAVEKNLCSSLFVIYNLWADCNKANTHQLASSEGDTVVVSSVQYAPGSRLCIQVPNAPAVSHKKRPLSYCSAFSLVVFHWNNFASFSYT